MTDPAQAGQSPARKQGRFLRNVTSIAARLALLSGLLLTTHSVALGADPDNSRVLVAQGGITTGQAVPCGRSYREVARGMSCQGLFDFQKSCRGELNALTVATALRLRCPEELLRAEIQGECRASPNWNNKRVAPPRPALSAIHN